MEDVVEAIRDNWSWAMPAPRKVIDINKFGNVLVEVDDGAVWRLHPDELSSTRVADDAKAAELLVTNPEFRADWDMHGLVEQAEAHLGAQADGHCFCLKLPAALGGKYEVSNIGTVPIVDLITFAGDVGRQVRDVADGETIRIVTKRERDIQGNS